MSQEKRNHWTAEEKVAILHKDPVERVAISDVCEQFQVAPVLFYRWQKGPFDTDLLSFVESFCVARNGRFASLPTACRADCQPSKRVEDNSPRRQPWGCGGPFSGQAHEMGERESPAV